MPENGRGKAPSPLSDIVDPAAQEDPNARAAGTEVWKAKQVFVSERGQGTA